MSKLRDEEYAKAYQKAYDEYQLAGSAYNIATYQQDLKISEIMERCRKHRDSLLDSPLKPDEFSPRTTAFDATEEERSIIRNFEIETIIYKRLFHQKLKALKYLEKHKKPAEKAAFKESILDGVSGSSKSSIVDLVFKITGIVAFIIVIKNAF